MAAPEPTAGRGAPDARAVALLDEAAALERAGGHWRLAHVCAVTGYSASMVRSSDCPRLYESRRPWFVPAEVRAWKAARLVRAEDRFKRAG